MTPGSTAFLNVLVVEDRPADAELLLYELGRAGYDVSARHADTAPAFLAALHPDLDLILADYSLPQFSAPEALQLMQERSLHVPFIVVTGTVSEEVAVECMKLGAADYLLKDRLARLGSAVAHALEQKRMSDQKRHDDEALRRYATELERRVDERTAELMRAKEHVEAILHHASDAILLMHLNGTVRQNNAAFYQMFGYETDAMLGRSALELVGDGHKDRFNEAFLAAVERAETQTVQLEARRVDGTVIDVEIALNLMRTSGTPSGIVCSIRDVTERMRMERALAEREARFRRLADNAHDTIFRYGVASNWRMEYLNPAVGSLTGYSPDEFYDDPSLAFDILTPEDSVIMREAFMAPEVLDEPMIVRVQHRDGRLVWVEQQAVPVYDKTGQFVAVEGIVRDVTARHQSEAELRTALAHERELNELKTRFASMVSHEFRTPLAIIQSSSDLLLLYRHRLQEGQQESQLREIQSQVKHLTGLLDDILALSQAQSFGIALSRQPIDLHQVASDISQQIQQTSPQHNILLSTIGSSERVTLDPKLVRQILVNLLNNAVKYSEPGSHIWFTVESFPEYAVITVKDEGIGIPPESQPYLFEMFHRAANVGNISGTGLGLPIVEQAVDAHDGTITFESALGRGTTFVVRLPYHALGET